MTLQDSPHIVNPLTFFLLSKGSDVLQVETSQKILEWGESNP